MKKKEQEQERELEIYTEDEEVLIHLELEDGSEMECDVLTRFPLFGRQYAALLPTEAIDRGEGEVFLYRFQEEENGEISLDLIEDDDEFEAAADRYTEIMNDQADEEEDEMNYDDFVDADGEPLF